MSEIVAVFLDTVMDGANLEEAHRMSRSGNMVPLEIGDTPSLKKFTATRAVDWIDSETIDETMLEGETVQDYDQRMNVSVNNALSDLQASKYEASIMSDALFVSARGGS